MLSIQTIRNTTDSCGEMEKQRKSLMCINGYVLVLATKTGYSLAINAINLLADRAQDESPVAAKILKDHTYVDDIAGSDTSPEKVKEAINCIDTILSKGKFTIKVWHSNNSEIDQHPNENPVSLLGHLWNKETDSIALKRETVNADLSYCTKRKALGLVSQLWDPLGLMAPVSIQFRIDLQSLWAAGYHWDELLPTEEKSKWLKNLEIMNTLLSAYLERCLKPENCIGSPQLHGFSDGGELGYGGALFLRWELANGKFTSRFVAAKALVAPLKKKTIPRLELMGCLVLSRLASEVEQALKINLDTKFWCDSTTALSWIESSATEFKPFVSVRVAEIQESQPNAVWNYITSEANPADALTRGISPGELQLWHQGPLFPLITPNDLILGPNFDVPQPEEEKVVNPRDLNKSVQRRVCHFWQCWMKYFAPDLLVRAKWRRSRTLKLEILC